METLGQHALPAPAAPLIPPAAPCGTPEHADPPPAITLTGGQRRYVEQARALADAGDAGREALAEHLGKFEMPQAARYPAVFGS